MIPLQLTEREEQLSTVSSRFLQLRQDFEYNLQLLDGRDAELMQYEAEVEGLQSGLEQQGCLVEELQASLSKAQTGKTFATVTRLAFIENSTSESHPCCWTVAAQHGLLTGVDPVPCHLLLRCYHLSAA